MKDISCFTIPHKKQRYDTLGDYFQEEPDAITFCVTDCGDWRMEAMIFMHELVEYLLVLKAGIPIKEVDAWDLAHLDSEEPGAEPGCPYRSMHEFAEAFERMIGSALGVGWTEYCKRLEEVSGDTANVVCASNSSPHAS